MPKEEEDDDVSSVDIDGSEDEETKEEDEEAMNDLSNADIVTKYRCAGDIANSVLTAIIEVIKPGVKAVELCKRGDDLVEEATSKVYNVKKGGKKVEKGSAFPTCISVNHCCGHYSPLTSEDDVTLVEGDVVKIDLVGNNMSGTLPARICSLSGLHSIDLSNNSLSGELPECGPLDLPNLQELILNSEDPSNVKPFLDSSIGTMAALKLSSGDRPRAGVTEGESSVPFLPRSEEHTSELQSP